MINFKLLSYSSTFVALFLCLFQATAFAYDEIIVNDPLSGADAHHATVAVNANGDIFVVWQESNVGLPDVVKGKVIRATISKTNPTLTISTRSPSFTISLLGSSNIVPDVASDGHNRFVVVWSSQDSVGAYQVKARLFGASGGALGPEFVVNDGYLVHGYPAPAPRPNLDARQTVPSKRTFLHANFPDVAMNSFGEFVVAWD